MKQKIRILILFVALIGSFAGRAQATIPTFDAVNAALNQLRNAIIQAEWAKEIALALERLEQLKATYSEIRRFHAGLDEYFETLVGDPIGTLFDLSGATVQGAFLDFGFMTPQIEILGNSSEPANIRDALEEVTGDIPDSEARPYIPFEEMQVVQGYQYAAEIRRAGEETRQAARDLSAQARTASPKGAARLGVEAQSQMLVIGQQSHEALAKLIEIEATRLEQVSREEKRYERARLKYMEEFKQGLDSLWEVG